MIILKTPFVKGLLRPCYLNKFFSSEKAVAAHHQHQQHNDHGQDHGHGHGHHAPYDWRDDFTKNPNYQQDILHRGVPDPKDYHTPFEHPVIQRPLSHPTQYNPKDLRFNLQHIQKIGPIYNTLRAPQTNIQGQIAHEYDYESEDLDFQPESFHTQHFRKKGGMANWFFVLLIPFSFISLEFFFQKYPDEDHWRYQRPPPLNFPDPEDTPDEDTYRLFKSGEFRRLYEAGILVPPFFEIIDGKKVYTKWSGVNQPMEIF